MVSDTKTPESPYFKRFLLKLRMPFTFPKEGKGDRLRWMSMRLPKGKHRRFTAIILFHNTPANQNLKIWLFADNVLEWGTRG